MSDSTTITLFGNTAPLCRWRAIRSGKNTALWMVVAFVSLAAAYDLDTLQQQLIARFGLARVSLLHEWQRKIIEARSVNEMEKLAKINEFFNRSVEFEDDRVTWNQSDYWATPLETIGRGQGDCEDFAIAKYYSLRYAGIPTSKLRLVYVKATLTRPIGPYRPLPGTPEGAFTQAHLVLAYYSTPIAEPLVLDNLTTEIKPASQRRDLQPVFSFNGEGIWKGVAGNAGKVPGGPGSLSRWADLLQRARHEGLE